MIKNRILGVLLLIGGISIAYSVKNDFGSFLAGIVSTIGFILAITGSLNRKDMVLYKMKAKFIFFLQLIISLSFVALGVYVIIANPGYGVSAVFKMILSVLVIGVFARIAIMAFKKLMASSTK